MTNYSITFVGILVMLLTKVLEAAGVEIGTEELTMTITTLVTLGGGLLALYGRWRKGDVNVFGMKK